MKKNRLPLKKYWLVSVPLAFLGLFYFYPLAHIFKMSLWPHGSLDLEKFWEVFSKPWYLRVLWFTFWQAALSTILTLVVALPGAWIMARYRFFGKNLLQSLTAVPFVLPTVVVAAAFEALLGQKGLVNTCLVQLFTLSTSPIQISQTVWFILLAHVFYNYTIVLRIVGGFWSRIDPGLLEAAQMLGTHPFIAFFKITLPLLRPALYASALLVFIFCFSSFGVILILGGSRFSTIETEIYQQAVNLFNLPVAAALSLIQIGFTFALMWIYTALQRKTSIGLNPESRSRTQKKVRGLKEYFIVCANAFFMLMFSGLPLIALVIRSFTTKNGFSFIYYTALFEDRTQSIFFVPPVNAIGNSLMFAAAAAAMALVIGMMAAVFLSGPRTKIQSFIDPVFMLPLSTSAVTLGFGFIIALDEPPLNLRTSLALMPLAHALVAFPFVVRSVLPALSAIPKSLKEAASVLGASPFKVWLSVDLPIMSRACVVGAVFAFTISLGEFGASVFTARPETPTMPLAIYRFLGQPGAMNYGRAMAMSSILMLVTAAAFMAIEKIRIPQAGEF